MSTARHAAVAGAAVTAAVASLPVALATSSAPAALAAGQAPVLPHTQLVRDLPPARALVTRIASESAGHTAVIASGDTLSGIARRFCGDPADWTGIWQQNKAEIPDPDTVYPGQTVRFTCEDLASLAGASDSGADSASTGNPGYQSPGSSYQAPVVADAVSQASGPWPGGSFGQCVVARESGGNAQVMNSTGHYGLYQFAAGTWAAYGGNPADFGHASVAEQEQVFMNAIAAGGQSNWSLYDGC